MLFVSRAVASCLVSRVSWTIMMDNIVMEMMDNDPERDRGACGAVKLVSNLSTN